MEVHLSCVVGMRDDYIAKNPHRRVGRLADMFVASRAKVYQYGGKMTEEKMEEVIARRRYR